MFDTQRFAAEISRLPLPALRKMATAVISQHFQGYRASELMAPWSLLFEECQKRSPSSKTAPDGSYYKLVPTALWAVCMRNGRVKSQTNRPKTDRFLSEWAKSPERTTSRE